MKYLDCGRYVVRSNKNLGEFIVTRFTDITEKIIPFFQKYRVVGVKALDYADFGKVAYIMKAGGHLTPEGLDQIIKIKSGMNRGRSS